MPECNRFFVYGTLRLSPPGNHTYFTRGITEDHEMARLDGYELFAWPPSIRPAAEVRDGKQPSVLGELYTVTEQSLPRLLHRLDRLETYFPERGYVRWVRAVLPVRTASGGRVPAYVYLGGPSFPYKQDDIVPDGDWVKGTSVRAW